MRKLIILIILLIVGCGGPDYPDVPPTSSTTPLPQNTVDSSIYLMTVDTFKFISTKAKYYEQIRPLLVNTDGESIFIDGNEFRILQEIDTTISSVNIVAYKVQGISGLFNNIEQIVMAYKEDVLTELKVGDLGIFTKDTPSEWVLNPVQEEANTRKQVQSDRKVGVHVVGTGDNLNDIARAHNMKLQELIELNRNTLTRNGRLSTIIRPGQKLRYYE